MSRVTTGRHTIDAHHVVRFHANVEWYVAKGPGEAYTGWIKCTHDHLDTEAAEKCRSRLAHRIRNNPHLFPDVQRALDEVNAEALSTTSVRVETD